MFRKAFIVFNFFLALTLVASFVAAWIDPIDSWIFGVLTLLFPFLVLSNLLVALLWLLFKSKWSLISLAALLISISSSYNWYALNFSSNENAEYYLKVSTYNVRLFNKYGWKSDKKTLSGMVAFIKKQQPDIALFQEFYHVEDMKEYNALNPFLDALEGYNYYFERQPSSNSVAPRFFGLAVFSKYPIVQTGILSLGPKTGKATDIFIDLLIESDTVRIYNVHLESLGFNKAEYSFIENTGNPNRTDQLYTSKTVLTKFKGALEKRAKQVNKLAQHIDECPYPIILGGDFNDTRSSYTYKKLTKELQDTFLEKGKGFGNTYLGKGIVPSMRIDFLLHSKHFETVWVDSPSIKLSDHDPVIATYKWKK